MQNFDFPAIYAAILFALFFVLVWVVVCVLLAELSGWRLLLRRFAADGTSVGGEKFSFVSAQMKRFAWLPISYNNCLSIEVNSKGFLLQILLLLRFRSPALFIPFSAIEAMDVEPAHYLFRKRTHLTFKALPVKMVVYGPAGDSIANAFQASEISP